MNLSTNLQRLLILGLSGPIVALNVWLLSQVYRYFEPIISLFAIAAMLAFLLNYLVQAFQRARLSRIQAATVVLAMTSAVLVVLLVLFVPLLVEQTNQLLGRIPDWLAASQTNLRAWERWAIERNFPVNIRDLGDRLVTQLETQLEALLKQTLSLAVATLSGLINTILVLVLTFYMLLYGDRLWYGLINLIPARIGLPLSESLRLNFHKFFICQILLAAFMTLTLLPYFLGRNVPFAVLFALVIGLAELVPLVGASLGIGLVCLLLALQNMGLAIEIAIVAVLLQQVRDNILAPRMMGNFTGLNPIWIFVALLAGLQIAGFLGIIVAVPIAGTIKSTIDAVYHLNPNQMHAKEELPEKSTQE
jgi:predicted PurR-regulated permease PerM